MKKLFFILILSFFYFISEAKSQCSDNFPLPKINIYYSYGKLSYDYSKNNEQITQIANEYNILEKGIFASGLSTSDINLDISIDTIGNINEKNGFCIYPQTINISIYFSNPTIYISSQLKQDSCEYNLVKRHEQTHMQINKSTLDYYLPLIYNAATEISKNITVKNIANISDIDIMSEQITKQFNDNFQPIFYYLKQQILKEQQKLDNQNNYQYENNLCL